MDIIVICFINFYEKHFLIFFDLFLVLLHLWEAGGQLIDINVHWQIQFSFYVLWGFISLLFTQTSNLSFFVYLFFHIFLHLCDVYNYKNIIFNKVKTRSLFISVHIKENNIAHHCIYVALLYVSLSYIMHSIYFECSIFLNTFLNVIQRLKCFNVYSYDDSCKCW